MRLTALLSSSSEAAATSVKRFTFIELKMNVFHSSGKIAHSQCLCCRAWAQHIQRYLFCVLPCNIHFMRNLNISSDKALNAIYCNQQTNKCNQITLHFPNRFPFSASSWPYFGINLFILPFYFGDNWNKLHSVLNYFKFVQNTQINVNLKSHF